MSQLVNKPFNINTQIHPSPHFNIGKALFIFFFWMFKYHLCILRTWLDFIIIFTHLKCLIFMFFGAIYWWFARVQLLGGGGIHDIITWGATGPQNGWNHDVPERVSMSCPTCGTHHDSLKITGNQSSVTVGERTLQHKYIHLHILILAKPHSSSFSEFVHITYVF